MTYIQQVLRVIVAQICQTIGWHSIQTTPLELLVDILHKYLQEITRDAYRHTELYNRTEPNLDDIGLCFRNLNINLSEIEEYINYVQPISCPIDIPKFPVHKDSNLNFLKPGSNEVLTRPVHINEHLPPIYPEKEIKQLPDNDLYNNDTEIICSDTKNSSILLSNGKLHENDDTIFKKPELQDSLTTNLNGGNIIMSSTTSLLPSSSGLLTTNFNVNKKTRFEEEGRPTREMSSVMMTSSGFISPAREGKLPESKPPIIQEYRPVRTPSPKLTSNIAATINSNPDNNNPSTSSSSGLGNSNLSTNNITGGINSSTTTQIPISGVGNNLNQNNKKVLNNLDAKLLKKLKKKSNNIDKEQRKRDKLSGKLLTTKSSSSTTTKPLSKNKLLKQLQKQQQQQQQQLLQQQQLKSKYNINKDKLTKKQKQKLKQQREFNMEHHSNIMKNLTSFKQHNKNNLNYQNTNAITLLQQSAAIAAATGIPLADIHQPSAISQQQHQQFLLQQQQNFTLSQQQHQQNLLSSNSNRFNPDIKLSAEPDKNKLNIFKKISSSGIKKEHKEDSKSIQQPQQNLFTNEQQQLISLPSGTTITPTTTNIQSNTNLPTNNDKKYTSLINDTDQIICVDDEEKLMQSTTGSTFLQDLQSNNNNNVVSGTGNNDNNNRSSLQQQQFNLTTKSKIPKKLKKKYLQQIDEQPLNLSSDKDIFNNNSNNIINNDNLSFKQQLKMLNNKNMENLLKQSIQQQIGSGSNKSLTNIKEKKERIKKTKIKEMKLKNTTNTTSSTVAQQFLQAVTAAAAAASNANNSSGISGNNHQHHHLLYPPTDIRSTDNFAAINKKLMKIDTVMQPSPTTINKLLSPSTMTQDDFNNINNKMNTSKSSIPSSSAGNVNAAAAAAANFFSKQYLTGGPMGSYIPQLFPFPLSFQPRPGLIPTPGLFPPLPPPPQQQSQSGIGDNPSTGFNEFLPMNMNFPIPNNNLIGGNNLNIDNNKIDNLSSSSSLNNNNNKNMNNYLDNKNDINTSNKILPTQIPQFLENKNYSNVAPLVPESMIQNYQFTKTKQQSRLNKQHQQQQSFIPSNLLQPQPSSSSLLTTNLDYHNKNMNQQQSMNLPLNNNINNNNDDIPIEISDDEKIKSDDDQQQQQQIKNKLIVEEQLLLKTINNQQELNNEQQQNINTQYQQINKNIDNDNKKLNYNKNINENRMPIESNIELFSSSDHDGGNIDYNINTTGVGGGGINSKFDKQQRKEHKKGKKFKDGKIKKKKDKKEKIKNKEKYDKKQRIKEELNNLNRKEKEKSKKLKKEKKKDKQRLPATSTTTTMNPLLPSGSQLLDDNFTNKSQFNNDLIKISNNDNNGDDSSAGDNTPQSGGTTTSSTSSSSAVPKLTLKLAIGKSPTPDSIESRKIVIKSTANQQQPLNDQLMIGGSMDYNYRRDPSPELARISPLVTRPPKQKSRENDKNNEIESPTSTTAPSSAGNYFPNISANPANITAPGNISNIQSISGNIPLSIPQLPQSVQSNPVVPRGPGRPKGSGNKNPSGTLNQPHQSATTSGIGGIGSTIVSGLDLNEPQSSNIIQPAVSSSTAHQPTILLNTTDAEGNQVWICPACGRVDDGTPMIGCDGCDAWYHWVCVGIQVPPDDNEDWYCRVCITKKQDVYESDKKKKRKKKNKTN